jgi:hypothetical protein
LIRFIIATAIMRIKRVVADLHRMAISRLLWLQQKQLLVLRGGNNAWTKWAELNRDALDVQTSMKS